MEAELPDPRSLSCGDRSHNRGLAKCGSGANLNAPKWGHLHPESKDIVKKTFKLNIEGKNRDRVLEATKHEIRKYVKRQRRVPLPKGVDFWDFDCKFGTSPADAAVVHFATITSLIDAVASAGGDAFYLEMLAKEGRRTARPAGTEESDLG